MTRGTTAGVQIPIVVSEYFFNGVSNGYFLSYATVMRNRPLIYDQEAYRGFARVELDIQAPMHHDVMVRNKDTAVVTTLHPVSSTAGLCVCIHHNPPNAKPAFLDLHIVKVSS